MWMDGLNYSPTEKEKILFTYEVQCINNNEKYILFYFVVVFVADTLH